jgi:polyphosphate kinase
VAAATVGTKAQPVLGRLLNRELSWLDFNARVLELAADPKLPLLERVKFCAIFS